MQCEMAAANRERKPDTGGKRDGTSHSQAHDRLSVRVAGRPLRATSGMVWALYVFGVAVRLSWPQEWVSLGPQESEPPLRPGVQTQLLVDNQVLCDWWQVRRVMGPVRKHPGNPVLQADKTWERHAAESWGVQPTAAVYEESEGIFKLWYSILQLATKEGGGVGYATSQDGIHWTKPNLGLIEFADAETGETILVDTSSRSFRNQYSSTSSLRFDQLRNMLRTINVDCISISTDKPYIQDLVRFFHMRHQRH